MFFTFTFLARTWRRRGSMEDSDSVEDGDGVEDSDGVENGGGGAENSGAHFVCIIKCERAMLSQQRNCESAVSKMGSCN